MQVGLHEIGGAVDLREEDRGEVLHRRRALLVNVLHQQAELQERLQNANITTKA